MPWFYTSRTRYIESYRFPAALDRKLAERRPEWPAAHRAEAIEGLRKFFLACLRAQRGGKRYVPMTSARVDDAWHEFILITPVYTEFCRQAFGRYLHHIPDDDRRRFDPSGGAGCGAAFSGDSCGHGGHAGHGCGASCGHGCGAGCGGGGCGSG